MVSAKNFENGLVLHLQNFVQAPDPCSCIAADLISEKVLSVNKTEEHARLTWKTNRSFQFTAVRKRTEVMLKE